MPVELWFAVPYLVHDVEPPVRDAIRAKVIGYLGAVDIVPGCLLTLPSEHFHAACHRQSSFQDFPRLTLAFWMER